MQSMAVLRFLTVLILVVAALAIPAASARKIIISSDLGDDVDDAFALVFALNSPELKIDAFIASWGPTVKKAQLAQKLLHIAGREDIPVLVGKHGENDDFGQLRWAQDWKLKKVVGDGPHGLVRRVMRSKEKVTLIPYGPLTDIAEMLKIEPKVKGKIDEIILMGGSAYKDYAMRDSPYPEHNIRSDSKAAQVVFGSGIQIVMCPFDVTAMMKLYEPEINRIKECNKPLCKALYEVYIAWGSDVPTMYDPVALAVAFQRDLVKMVHTHVDVTDDGYTKLVPDAEPNAYVCLEIDKERFMKLFMDRILK